MLSHELNRGRVVQSARRLLRDNSKGTAEPKRKAVRWARVYTRNQVARHLHKERFDKTLAELSENSKAGEKNYIAHFRKAEKKVYLKLSAAEKVECQKTVNEWNKRSAPRSVQLKAFAKDKDKPFEKFTRDMFRAYGIRLVILGTFLDKTDKVGHLV